MKYIICSDLNFLSLKRMSEAKKYLVVKIIMYLFFCFNNMIFIESALGLNFEIKSIDFISLFPYLINTIFCYYMIIKIIEKDMNNMYSTIFTRLPVYKWLFSKIFSYVLMLMIIKLFEYVLVILLFSFNNSLIEYYIIEIVYGMLIETAVIICYLFQKNKWSFCIILILSFILIPKTLIDMKNYILPISAGIIIINLILILIAYYKNNTFFNLIGGAYDRNKKYN